MIQPQRTFLALATLAVLALGLRVAAALAVDHWAEARGERFLFPDSEGYWILAGKLAAGEPYAYGLGNPRHVMRTPGYPLLLAAGIKLFGDSLLAARLAGAVLGTAACLLVYPLARRLVGHSSAVVGVGLAAVDPYFVLFSVLLLSETLFAAAVLVSLYALARVLDHPIPRAAPQDAGAQSAAATMAAPHSLQPARRTRLIGSLLWPAAAGLLAGAATLVRPSWLLFCPLLLVGWSALTRRRSAVVRSLIALMFLTLSLVPWAWRNWRATGHFVPLTLWVGASLYDGLHPGATGASDMRFLEQAPWKTMHEFTQDRELRREAWDFVRSHPAEALRLAGVKLLRFWSPWPNAPSMDAWPIRAASLLWAAALAAAVLYGLGACRRQPTALLLLAAPVLYLCAIHLVFVGSIRYRIPGMYPLLGLAGLGLVMFFQHARPAALPSPKN